MALAVVLVCAIYNPSYLSDHNEFTRHFAGFEVLELLGIIMTITLASAANLHLEFNKIEEKYNHPGLTKTRRGVMQGAFFLIGLFLFAGAIVVVKPLMPDSETLQAIVNGIVLIIVLFNVLILLELTQLAFAIQPEIKED
jgi:hypothetical protein